MINKYIVTIITLLHFVFLCNNVFAGTVLTEVKVIGVVKADDIRLSYKKFLQKMEGSEPFNLEEELSKVKYDVVFTKVEYNVTDPFGTIKTVSGLVGYPLLPAGKKSKGLHIVSYQHGTITYESQAPSNKKLENFLSDIQTVAIPSFKNGYVFVAPDYFGYGSDEQNMHYYQAGDLLALTARELIDGVSDYMAAKSISINVETLYLFGYSEGGFATMATLKSYSETPSRFTNIVTVAGSGSYDTKQTAIYINQQEKGDSPVFTASYAWVTLVFNKIYGINRELDKLFRNDVVAELQKYVDNDLIMTTKILPSVPTQVFNPNFTEGVLKETDKEFISALDKNNFSDFNAKGNITLVYGDKDTWVPSFNTDSAYIRLQRRGVDVTKKLLGGGDHAKTSPYFTLLTLLKL